MSELSEHADAWAEHRLVIAQAANNDLRATPAHSHWWLVERSTGMRSPSEEYGVLRDYGQRSAQRMQPDRPDVHTVDKDRAATRLDHSKQAHDQRRFTATRATHDADLRGA